MPSLFFSAEAGDSYPFVTLYATRGADTSASAIARLTYPGYPEGDTHALLNPAFFTVVGSKLYFWEDLDSVTEADLWVTNGTPSGTFEVASNVANVEAVYTNTDAAISPMTDFNGDLYYTAYNQLWTIGHSDSTPTLVGSFGTDPSGFETVEALSVVNNTLFFFADAGSGGRRPWSLDAPGPSPFEARFARTSG